MYILHALFNFNDDVSLRFNRRIFHRCSCGLFHLRFFLFFFYILSFHPFRLFSQSGSGTRAPNFVRRRQIGNILRHEIGNGSTNIFVCVCVAGATTYIRSCRLVIKYPPSWRPIHLRVPRNRLPNGSWCCFCYVADNEPRNCRTTFRDELIPHSCTLGRGSISLPSLFLIASLWIFFSSLGWNGKFVNFTEYLSNF